jgi:hypothetical protein
MTGNRRLKLRPNVESAQAQLITTHSFHTCFLEKAGPVTFRLNFIVMPESMW